MTVWVDTPAHDPQDVASILTSGVNGIITTQSTLFASVLKQFPKNTLYCVNPLLLGIVVYPV